MDKNRISQINELKMLLSKLENRIGEQKLINASISKASVGWHIEHALLTINAIMVQLQHSDSASYSGRFKISQLIVFTFNRIPRGRANSPTVVLPINYTSETLKQHLFKTKEKLTMLELLTPGKYFNHPILGQLKLRKAIRFMIIHTQHHLKIINDIIKVEKFYK